MYVLILLAIPHIITFSPTLSLPDSHPRSLQPPWQSETGAQGGYGVAQQSMVGPDPVRPGIANHLATPAAGKHEAVFRRPVHVMGRIEPDRRQLDLFEDRMR